MDWGESLGRIKTALVVVVAPYVALLVPECHAEPIVLNDESPTGYSFVDDRRFYDPTANLSAAQVTCPCQLPR